MRVTTNLLRQFGTIPASDGEIIKLIKEHIAEVEEYHDLTADYEGIVIAQITDKKDHPDSDKLAIYQISTGTQSGVQVVAGDKTLQIDDKVAYIPVGAIVPYSVYTEEKPVKIGVRKLGGFESNGMMASQKELNIGSDHTQVFRLPKDAPVGESFAKYFGLEDTFVEIENKGLTNRGDLFGIIGLSRELTAITGNRFTSPKWFTDYVKDLKPEENCLNIHITNDAEVLCPRYTAIAMDNIKIEQSPIEIRSTFIKCGIKPTNNIVDITNYISLIFGQPMHAFDYDKIVSNDPNGGDRADIKIRLAHDGESILGLDNKIHTLNSNMMVIADSTNPIAIAGVIGGKDTEVDFNTHRIIFESANFDKNNIRKTSMELGVFTDACTKYKHSLDTEMTLPALKKAVLMAKELAGAKIASEIIDIYEIPFDTNQTIKINIEHLNTIAGINFKIDEVKNILENLEYKVTQEDESSLIVFVPSWRRDTIIREDLYEDIIRVYGYNKVDAKLPKKQIIPPKTNKIFELKKDVRAVLSSRGANEITTYSFVSLKNFKECDLDPDKAFRLVNSLSPELFLMRTTILQSVLQKAKENISRGFDSFILFEEGISHLKDLIDKTNVPEEEWMLSLVIADGNKDGYQGSPYYEVKKYIDDLFIYLGYSAVTYTLTADASEQSLQPRIKNILPMFDPNTSAVISMGQESFGIIGELKDTIKKSFKLPPNSSACELSLSFLSEQNIGARLYKDVPVYPSFSIDLCFKVDMSVQYLDMYNEIELYINRKGYYGSIECLDIYQGKDDENKKKITFRIKVSSYEGTFTNKQIELVKEGITKNLSKRFNAHIV